jgi:hypothetical protein
MWKYRTSPRKTPNGMLFSTCYLYKRIYNRKKLEYKARTGRLRGELLDSGFYEGQTYGALNRAWFAYTISCKHEDWKRREYYAAVIRKLEKELGLALYPFEEIKNLAADFLDEHQDEPSIHDMSIDEIVDIMRKSDSEFWQSVH